MQEAESGELKQRAKEAALRIVDYIHDNRIATIISVGPSARYSASFLVRALKKKYPQAREPELHSLGRIQDYFAGKTDAEFAANLELAAAAIRRTRPKILGRLAGPVLLFDEEAESGKTLKGAKQVFEKHLNAQKVHTATFQARPAGVGLAHHEPSIVGMRERYLGIFPIHPERGMLEEVSGVKRKKLFKSLKQARQFWNEILKEI